jgi:hypothetical protein
MSHFSNTTHGLPLNGNPTNYVRSSSTSMTRQDESNPPIQCVDIGTPNYPTATNCDRVVFNARGDANGPPVTRGIPLLSLLERGVSERLEGAADTPFESTPVSQADRIEIEFHVRIDMESHYVLAHAS